MEGAECSPARDRIKFTEQRLEDPDREDISSIQQFNSSATIILRLNENWIGLQGERRWLADCIAGRAWQIPRADEVKSLS